MRIEAEAAVAILNFFLDAAASRDYIPDTLPAEGAFMRRHGSGAA
jgi:hypothetical protein